MSFYVSDVQSTGRLELFARYGPVDEAGKLRGGIAGSHVHTDLEIRQMIQHETREAGPKSARNRLEIGCFRVV